MLILSKCFILPHNMYDIKRNPQVAVHLQCSTMDYSLISVQMIAL